MGFLCLIELLFRPVMGLKDLMAGNKGFRRDKEDSLCKEC